MDKNKTTVTQLDANQKSPGSNDSEMDMDLKKTIAKNKEIIEKNREMLGKYKIVHNLNHLLLF